MKCLTGTRYRLGTAAGERDKEHNTRNAFERRKMKQLFPSRGYSIARQEDCNARYQNRHPLVLTMPFGVGGTAKGHRESPTMSTGTRAAPRYPGNSFKAVSPSLSAGPEEKSSKGAARQNGFPQNQTAQIYIASENRLLREALARMLTKKGDIEVIAISSAQPSAPELPVDARPDLMLLTSRGVHAEDMMLIRKLRIALPDSRLLFIGMSGDESEFLQLVRAGISGYLLRDASAEDVVRGVRSVLAGDAVCPGKLCAVLFRFFEREAGAVPSASLHQRLGLTRREQQLLPLIAQGLTNKEIANQFCLSEQTVKNHLYRMKHKIGAEDRLEMVQLYRTHGFLV